MRNSRLFCIILSGLIATILISCGNSRILREAETLLETNPAEADSILASIPAPRLRRDRAWYAVLKTQAEYKQYKPVKSDSLILTATSYYGNKRKNYHAALAWYTQGCVYKELQDDVSAIDAYLKAKDLFPDTLIRYYALTVQNLAKCYLNKFLYEDALSSLNNCRNLAAVINDSSMLAYANYQIATTKLYKKQFSNLSQDFMKLYHDKNLSEFYRNQCLVELAKISILHYCQYDSAKAYLEQYKKYQYQSKGLTYNLIGDIHYLNGEIDSAYYYYNLSKHEICDIYTLSGNYKSLSEISLLYGNNQDAFKYGKLYTETIDSIRILQNANDIAVVQIAHNTEMDRINRQTFHIKNIIISTSIVIIMALLLWGLYQSHLNTVSRNYIRFCDGVWTTISTSLPSDSSLNDLLKVGKIKYMNSPSHFILFGSRNKPNINKDARDAIIHDLNIAFSDTIERMLKDYPTLNNREILLCLLNHLKIDKTLICDTLNMTNDNYRKVKSRLKEKIWDSYVLFFT